MKGRSQATLLVLLLYIAGILGNTMVVHEQRDASASEKHSRTRLAKDILLPMRIGLRENSYATRNAENWLMDVADPSSSNFGRYWTQKEVIQAFKPTEDTIRKVAEWLNSYGVSDFTHTDNKMWFAFDISVEKAESMLDTEYFEQTIDGDTEAFSDYYRLPVSLREHIHYITPGVKGTDITGRSAKSTLVNRTPALHSAPDKTKRNPSGIPSTPPNPPLFNGLQHCYKQVTPACIRALYNFSVPDPSLSVSPNNSMGIFEGENNAYYQGDLDYFYSFFSPNIPNGTSPFYEPIDGAVKPLTKPTSSTWKYVSAETSLDLEIALPIIYPQNVTVYDVSSIRFYNPPSRHNYFNRFLDAIDGSYCSYEQRNNSNQGGKPVCGVFKPTNVISFSWGSPEIQFSHFWQERQCNEYLKLGLQGVSLFICSQDYGVSGLDLQGDASACKENNKTGPTVFMPYFPASCPWVTAVGSTHIADGNSVYQSEKGAVYSGGGFSLNFETPTYQKNAIDTFFKSHNPPWPYFYNGSYNSTDGRYNRNGRGIPDMSAVGTQIPIITDLIYATIYGTSASTPVVAALFNRIVEERIRAGKGPLGFINPTLYQNSDALNDIVGGHNGACVRDEGFAGVPGWDPITGLGTPNYGRLLDVFMRLP